MQKKQTNLYKTHKPIPRISAAILIVTETNYKENCAKQAKYILLRPFLVYVLTCFNLRSML